MRKFNNGAIRSSADGKIDWLGVRHPLVEASFGEYMNKHRNTEDGGLREFNNWWGGWSESVSIQSLNRHVEDLNAIESGYYVYKAKDKNGERTVVSKKPIKLLDDTGLRVSKSDCYNAIKFNCNAGLLEYLKNNKNE